MEVQHREEFEQWRRGFWAGVMFPLSTGILSPVPNWAYLLVAFAYNASLAVWLGGGLVLGAIAAPTLFRSVEPRSRAGAVFGEILRTYARLRLVTIVLALAAAAIKAAAWEHQVTGGPKLWIAIRWLALTWMIAAVVYELAFLEKGIRDARDLDGGGSERFANLHGRAELLMKSSMVAAAIAMFLN